MGKNNISPEYKQLLAETIKLQEIEGNPLTEKEVSMFEMMEREKWSREKRRIYILKSIENDINSSTDE